MAGFLAAKAEFLFNATFAFFWGKLGDFDRIYDHGVGVVGFGVGGIGEGVVGLMGGSRVSLGDIVSSLPLGLEGDGFLVPFVDGGGTVSIDMIRCMSGGGIPAEKYPIRTFGSEMLARATWFLKVEMYSVREGE